MCGAEPDPGPGTEVEDDGPGGGPHALPVISQPRLVPHWGLEDAEAGRDPRLEADVKAGHQLAENLVTDVI